MKAWVPSFGLVALLFALLCAPLLVSTQPGGYADDETLYHLPAIRQIRAHWPALDLNRDTLSAVSPGYHYVFATVSLITGTGRLPLRLVTWGLSLGLLALLWRLFPASMPDLALAALLPLACSNFFIKSASWIVTDNPGLLCAAAALAAIFLLSNPAGGWVAGALAGLATFLRQWHVWIVVPLGLRALRQMKSAAGPRPRALALVPLLVPIGVLGALMARWHGLVPPAWQAAVSQGSISTAPLCYLFAVFFMLGIFYVVALPPGTIARSDWRSPWTLGAAAAGLLLALAGPIDYNIAAGRWGGYLWAAAAKLPLLGQRSVLFLLLTPLGAALLAVMTQRLVRQSQHGLAMLWLGAFLAWTATALPSRVALRRYFEPTVLIFLIFWILLMVRGTEAKPSFRPAGLYAVAFAQILITLATAHYNTYGRSLLTGG